MENKLLLLAALFVGLMAVALSDDTPTPTDATNDDDTDDNNDDNNTGNDVDSKFRDAMNNAVSVICQDFDTTDKRSLEKRGWLSKVWKKVRPHVIAAATSAIIGKRDIETQGETQLLEKRGWLKKTWKKVKPYVQAAVLIKQLSGKRSFEADDEVMTDRQI
ncbi:hypothetical protein Btru_036271 [Bulinus truncatus]|nr:hypothetical protein Btru_036271 [Bulinus truncatus]